MTTTRTGLRRIRRIQDFNRNPGKFGFVQDKLLQLVKRPAMQIATLRATNPYPVADTLQILNSNTASGVFSPIDNLFADTVVFLFGESPLTAGKPLKHTPRRLGSFGLQSAALPKATAANAEHVHPAVLVAVAIGGDVDDTKINAQNAVNVNQIGRFNLTGNEQVEVATNGTQVGFTPVALQEFPGAFPTNERDMLAAGECPDRRLPLKQIKRQDTRIVGESAMLLKAPLLLLAGLIAVSNLGDSTDDHLRGEGKLLTGRMVRQPVQAELAEHLLIESLFANPVARGVRLLKRGSEKLKLFRRGLQFNLCHQLHIVKFSTYFLSMQEAALRAVRIALLLERGSILRSLL